MKSKIVRLREAAAQRQAGRCFYRTFPMLVGTRETPIAEKAPAFLVSRLKCTAEHLVPKADGGDTTAKNIVAACQYCNRTRHRSKKPRAYGAYQDYVRRRIGGGRWHPHEVRTAIRNHVPGAPAVSF
jgi:hypothetical protein